MSQSSNGVPEIESIEDLLKLIEPGSEAEEYEVKIVEGNNVVLIDKLCGRDVKLCRKKGVFQSKNILKEIATNIYKYLIDPQKLDEELRKILASRCRRGNNDVSFENDCPNPQEVLKSCNEQSGNGSECYSKLLNYLKDLWRCTRNVMLNCISLFDTCYDYNKAKKLFDTIAKTCKCDSQQGSNNCWECMIKMAILASAALHISIYGSREDFWKVQYFIDLLKSYSVKANGYFPACASDGDVAALLYLAITLTAWYNKQTPQSPLVSVRIKKETIRNLI